MISKTCQYNCITEKYHNIWKKLSVWLLYCITSVLIFKMYEILFECEVEWLKCSEPILQKNCGSEENKKQGLKCEKGKI